MRMKAKDEQMSWDKFLKQFSVKRRLSTYKKKKNMSFNERYIKL